MNRRFVETYRATIGADFLVKTVALESGEEVTLQMWDTAGQERFQSLGTAFYRGADCCILVYDLTSQESFDSLQKWMDDFVNFAGIPDNGKDFPFALVGNKADLGDARRVSAKVASKWCDIQPGNVVHFEVSAKDGSGLEDAFISLASMTMESMPIADVVRTPQAFTVKPNASSSKKGCC